MSGFDHRCDDWKLRRDCLHPAGEYYRIICANGAEQVKLLCTACHTNMLEAGQSVPRSAVPIDGIEIIADLRNDLHPCARCGAPETEEHHWAPKHLFDDYAEWPTSYLCIPCHLYWHVRIIEHFQAA